MGLAAKSDPCAVGPIAMRLDEVIETRRSQFALERSPSCGSRTFVCERTLIACCSGSATLRVVVPHPSTDLSDAKTKYPDVGFSDLLFSGGTVPLGAASGVASPLAAPKLDSWLGAEVLEAGARSPTLRMVTLPRAEFVRSGIWIGLHMIGFLRSADSWDRFTKLHAILNDLNGVQSEAQEQGYPDPTPIAIRNSKYLVEVLYSIVPLRYEVYPTICGEIAIDTPGGLNASALVLCGADGNVMYIASSANREFSGKDLSVEEIPDPRLCQILALLAEEYG